MTSAARSLLLMAVLTLSLPGAVVADCQPAGSIEEALGTAPIAFVGTAVAVDGPRATFAVSEVWKGEVAEVVQVRGLSDEVGGPDAGFGAGFTEDDRHWTPEAVYLVVPWADGEVLRDSICTATTEWRPELGGLRPATARIVDGATDEGRPPLELVLLGVIGMAVLGVATLAFRRQ